MVYYCDKQLYRILTTRLLPVLVYFVWMVPANVDGACFMVKTYWNTLLEFHVNMKYLTTRLLLLVLILASTWYIIIREAKNSVPRVRAQILINVSDKFLYFYLLYQDLNLVRQSCLVSGA